MLASKAAGSLALSRGHGGLRRHLHATSAPRADFTHAVIGGGVVGLAIARQLSQRPNTSTVLIERHAALGTETSSRNSEVIHAGIYYGRESLKARLCLRGKHLLYDFCAKHGVPHRRVGKWIVAQDDAQRDQLEKLRGDCAALDVPTRWVSEGEVRRRGEGVRARRGALESPTTGIVDAHALMAALRGLFEHHGGLVALRAPVTGVRPLGPGRGWRVDVRDASAAGEATASVTAEALVNAAGLGAVHIHNMVVPEARRRKLYFAKGNYFAYAAARPRVSRLVYPAPTPGAAGLGTHLTLDMAGRLRFGPDVEWVDSPDHLAVSEARLARAADQIREYLPGVDPERLHPDYAGIRPKLTHGGSAQMGANFDDFVVHLQDGRDSWVDCLGIESPGLTSCLAIAERVHDLLYARPT
ncbi:uncharacterized protein UV8b_01220 [Ustilaginoidea virens]|uniref:L-2-hydroxyglutarate dehydrogenase, mitochondrial n=1 Tax=Ustilaginoidea virens TaxID=1159556 RepID=A0A1B5L3W1_USTVR|nr:uncharacterized protein UV8b_01220 [Ustilaginoidea virens]QUC16979.1 hypothetical protein UV8b_01220 [Ustilaginoidea virens]GAO18196.1 hypothetical protein UVI_02036910 [Ustilaginoidea virens]